MTIRSLYTLPHSFLRRLSVFFFRKDWCFDGNVQHRWINPCIRWFLIQNGTFKGMATLHVNQKHNFEAIWRSIQRYFRRNLPRLFIPEPRDRSKTVRGNLIETFFSWIQVPIWGCWYLVRTQTHWWYGCSMFEIWWWFGLGLRKLWRWCPTRYIGSRFWFTRFDDFSSWLQLARLESYPFTIKCHLETSSSKAIDDFSKSHSTVVPTKDPNNF